MYRSILGCYLNSRTKKVVFCYESLGYILFQDTANKILKATLYPSGMIEYPTENQEIILRKILDAT